MTRLEAVAHTFWDCAEYNAERPPGDAARLFLEVLADYGYTVEPMEWRLKEQSA